MEKEEAIKYRDELRTDLENDIKEKGTKNEFIGKIVYYSEYEIINQTEEHMGLEEKDIFVVTRHIYEDENYIQKYELYDKENNLLAHTNAIGEIVYEENYKEKVKARYGGYYNEIGIDERKSYMVRENEFSISDKPYDKLNEKEKEELQEKANDIDNKKLAQNEFENVEQARKDMKYGENDILYSTEIKDKRFYEQIPSAKKYDGNAMLIYSKKEQKFVIGGMVNGEFKPSEDIEPSRSTMRTSIDLNRDGTDIERETITGIMNVKGNNDYAYSIDVSQSGYIEFQELRKDLYTNKYITADLETTKQHATTLDVERIMDKTHNYYINDEIEAFKDLEHTEEDKIDLDEIEMEKAKEELNKEETDEGRVPWPTDERRF